MKETRGYQREQSLGRNEYFSDAYFSLPELNSLAHQLNHIWALQPASVIEIGIGNGFVSSFLKRAGVPVTTIDINPELQPDYCAPLSEVPNLISNRVDLVVCCEVLEHMPIDELDNNLDCLKSLGNRLFMTLPNSYRTIGFGGVINTRKRGPRNVSFYIDVPPKRTLHGSPHFWEVNYNKSCSRKAIVSKLLARYETVKSGRFALNPYHFFFECE